MKTLQTNRSEEVEATIIRRILDGTYPAGTRLPLERDLAVALGVGRPTLREAIQRLARDGWLTVRRTLGTRVNDYWREGTLNIVPAIIHDGSRESRRLILWLMELRVGVAPLFVRQAVAAQPARVVAVLVRHQELPDEVEAYVQFDYSWQVELAALAPNPLFTLYHRSFREAWFDPAREYFAQPEHRKASRGFYAALLDAAMAADAPRAEAITREAMVQAVRLLQPEASGR